MGRDCQKVPLFNYFEQNEAETQNFRPNAQSLLMLPFSLTRAHIPFPHQSERPPMTPGMRLKRRNVLPFYGGAC